MTKSLAPSETLCSQAVFAILNDKANYSVTIGELPCSHVAPILGVP
jgi:hypothetical protein